MNKRHRCFLGLWLLLSSFSLCAQEDSVPRAKPFFLQDTSSQIQVLYEARNKRTVTAAVSDIRTAHLLHSSTSTYGGWLSGRLAGVHTYQSGGEPGFDDVSVFVRGQAPLVLMDGTPQSFPSINPEQIESITVLKDAVSTALLGMRASGGAILINTRKGERKPGQIISLTAQYGTQQPTRQPRFLRSYDYARLYNEALANDGIAPVYSTADLEAYQNGSDPIGHPDVNWQKEILRQQSPYSRYNVAISGGNRTTRYFVNLDHLNQQGLLKTEDFNTYSTNSEYKRYSIRSNIEVDLTNSLTTSLNLVGRVQNSNQPGASTSAIFSSFRNTPNNAYPKLNADSSLAGNLDYQSNIYGESVLTGYIMSYERDFKVDLALKGKLDKLARGLWIKGLAAINAYQHETTNRSKTFAVYKQQTDAAGAKTYSKFGNTGDQANSNTANSQNRLFYTEASVGYDKKLRTRDNLNALILLNNDYRMVNTDLPFSFTTLGAKVSYNHSGKYFVDLVAAYNGTERFPKAKRYGVFPALGLGWLLSEESFLKGADGWLNELKLRASWGTTGNANVGYYDYYQYYTTGNGYGFGSTVPSSTTTLQPGTLANPLITWEKADKLSAGVDAALLRHRLLVTLDYFNDKYYDLVQSRNNGSDIFGTGYMQENIGRNRYSGWELSATWQDSKGVFAYFLAPNATLVKSQVEYMAEVDRRYAYQRQTGQPVGQAYGYVAEGLFASEAEIDAHAFQGATIMPGDIKYKDLNKDGVIDAGDQQAIGNKKPFVFYGFTSGLSFKGLELSVVLQGTANQTLQLTGYRAFQNGGRGQAYDWQLDRWTPENLSASYPRLWVGNNTNNMLTSTFWIRKANYLRVKNVELAYTLPSKVARKGGLSGTRLFINATNLLTFSSLNDLDIDPEAGPVVYPLVKTIVAGVHLNF